MARYNSVLSSTSLSAGSTTALTTPIAGQFTEFTGTTYGVTIGDPALYSGQSQTFYNAASGVITLTSGGSGQFKGPGASNASTINLPTTSTLTLYSDGANWITAFDGGGPLVATTGVFSGDITNSNASANLLNSPTTINAFTGATSSTIGYNSTLASSTTIAGGATASGNTATVNIANAGGAGSTTSINLGATTSATTVNLNGTLALNGISSGFVKLAAPSTAGSQSYVFPSAYPGVSGYALTSTTGGTLSWANVQPVVTDTTTNATFYPVFNSTNTGQLATANVASSGITFNPSTNNLVVAGTVNSLRSENVQTGSYTFALSDRDKCVTMIPSGGNTTLTVPLNSSVAFPIGTVLYACNANTTYTVTLAAAGGVTLSKSGVFGQYEELYIRKRGTDTWIVVAATTNGGATQTGGTFTNLGATSQVVYTTASNNSGTFKAN
jgi:hypothetical protein